MFLDNLSYFFTITITTITTIITVSTFTYMKNLYINIFNNKISNNKISSKKIYIDKNTQTDITNNIVRVDVNTQTDISMNIDTNIGMFDSISNSFIIIKHADIYDSDISLENLMLLARDQLNIQNNPSQYQWISGL